MLTRRCCLIISRRRSTEISTDLSIKRRPPCPYDLYVRPLDIPAETLARLRQQHDEHEA